MSFDTRSALTTNTINFIYASLANSGLPLTKNERLDFAKNFYDKLLVDSSAFSQRVEHIITVLDKNSDLTNENFNDVADKLTDWIYIQLELDNVIALRRN